MSVSRGFRICDALNAWKPALNLLRRKGYKLFISPDSREEFYGKFWAIKDGRDFIARDPVALLGLVQIGEEYGDGWQSKNQNYEDIQDELATIAFPDEPYSELSDEDFARILDYWSEFFIAVDANLADPITRKDLYNFFTNPSD